MKPSREQVLTELARVGREHSDATVLFHSSVAGKLGLHPTDYKVLGMLLQQGALAAGDIAERTGLAPASVTNLIQRLERKQFVRRVQDPSDLRRVLVEVKPDKISDKAAVFSSTVRTLAELFERYSTNDLTVIASFLEANAARLRDETAKLTRSP
jgi:DNA-binding MarR family transcriptional regulator